MESFLAVFCSSFLAETEEGLKQERNELMVGGWQNQEQDYKVVSAMQGEEFWGNSIDSA